LSWFRLGSAHCRFPRKQTHFATSGAPCGLIVKQASPMIRVPAISDELCGQIWASTDGKNLESKMRIGRTRAAVPLSIHP
jgi:hypothetical protein